MSKAGKLPYAEQLPTGTIIVNESSQLKTPKSKSFVVVYSRVSSSEQAKTNLETQAERISKFVEASGVTVNKVVKEVGSGLNDKRPLLVKMLNDDNVTDIFL